MHIRTEHTCLIIFIFICGDSVLVCLFVRSFCCFLLVCLLGWFYKIVYMLCMCVYVCLCACVCSVYVMYVYVCLCMYVDVSMCLYVCMCLCACKHGRAQVSGRATHIKLIACTHARRRSVWGRERYAKGAWKHARITAARSNYRRATPHCRPPAAC